jgi:hypothetical protein
MPMLLLNTQKRYKLLAKQQFFLERIRRGLDPYWLNILDKGVYRKVESRIAKQK